MSLRRVAVIDIGKTNAKLALVDLEDLSEIAVETRSNVVRPGPPYPHFDVEGHWRFILDGLARFQEAHGVDAIATTTHGACAALLEGEGGLAAPILDYEHDGPDALAAAYDAMRPGFAETGSPRLPRGLNLGAQLHWLFETQDGLRARTAQIVPYPQYWSHRLTGVASADPTLLGAHTDLWNPHRATFSSLADRLGLRELLAPMRRSGDVLGPILPAIARETGLAPTTPVVCGIHDSNASLYPHLLTRPAPFTVISTGTWVIVMAVGGDAGALDPARDTLINVDAFGRPTPSARFMGGREYEIVNQRADAVPSRTDVDAIIDDGPMLLPAVEPSAGPFMGREAEWIGAEPPVGSPARSAALSLYLAMVTVESLRLAGHQGDMVVEGAFARNVAFLEAIAELTGQPVLTSASATGTSVGAALLHKAPSTPPQASGVTRGRGACRLFDYHRRWAESIHSAR